MTDNDSFNLLKSKEIIAILDGDTDFGNYEFEDTAVVKVSLPYLSGPKICEISSLFGYSQMYSSLSRWEYFDTLLGFCIQNNRVSDLLSYLMKIDQFKDKLRGHNAEEITKAHSYIIDQVIKGINGLLLFGGNELSIVGDQFRIKPIGSVIHIETPKIKTINREYIKSISSRALSDVDSGNYDSAITKSRTLLEETFFYVLELKNEVPLDNGDINALYKQVRNLYNMHTDKTTDRRINTLLSGLNSIVSAIAEMRNKDSDAHGVGANRISIDEHHARLFVNSSMTMADFILSVAINQK